MAEFKKIIEDKDLNDVSGGVIAKRRKALYEDIMSLLPENVKVNLTETKSNVEVCKLLAENGVDLELIEDKIKEAYAKMKVNVLELKDTELETVVAGFDNEKYGDIHCWKCGTSDRDDFSYQFWASNFIAEGRIYRCKICDLYYHFINDVEREVWNKYQYADWLNKAMGVG